VPTSLRLPRAWALKCFGA